MAGYSLADPMGDYNQHPEDYAQKSYAHNDPYYSGLGNDLTKQAIGTTPYPQVGIGGALAGRAVVGDQSLLNQLKMQRASGSGLDQLRHVSLQSETANLTLAANRIRSAVNRLSEALFGPTPEPNCTQGKGEDSTDSIQNNVRVTSQVLNESAQSLEALLTKISSR